MTEHNAAERALFEAKEKYAREAAERWGKTDAYRESVERAAARDENATAVMEQDANDIFAAFAAIMDKSPASPEAQALVERWLAHITRYYYPCTKEILACLGQMYTADERFTATLDRFGDGNARFISEAIALYCEN